MILCAAFAQVALCLMQATLSVFWQYFALCEYTEAHTHTHTHHHHHTPLSLSLSLSHTHTHTHTHIHTQIFKTPLSPPLSVSLSLSLCLCLSLSLSFSLSLFLSVCLSVSLCAVEADLECPFSQQRNRNQVHFILSCPMYYDLRDKYIPRKCVRCPSLF